MLNRRLYPGSEQRIIGPVRYGRAKSGHRNVVYEEHDGGEYRQRQYPVRHHLVYSVRNRQCSPCFFSDHRHFDHILYIGIPLICDDTFRIIIHLLLAVFDMHFYMPHQRIVKGKVTDHFFISFKKLDCIPAQVVAVYSLLY